MKGLLKGAVISCAGLFVLRRVTNWASKASKCLYLSCMLMITNLKIFRSVTDREISLVAM